MAKPKTKLCGQRLDSLEGFETSLMSLVRVHRVVGALIEERCSAMRPDRMHCLICGNRVRKKRRQKRGQYCRDIEEFGKARAKALRAERLKDARSQPTEFVSVVVAETSGREQRAYVCSRNCHAIYLETLERNHECLRLLHNNREQLKAIKRYLITGNLAVFQSLPREFGPDLNSHGSCRP